MNSVLWFLPCLFSTEVAYWLVRRMHLRVAFVLVACVALAFAMPWLTPGLPWGLGCVPYYLLFMMLGAEMTFVLPWDKVGCSGTHIVVLTIGVVGYVVAVYLLPNPVAQDGNRLWWFAFVAFAAVGCVLFSEVAKVMSGKILQACGKASMGIMLTHKFAVVFLEMKVPVVRSLLEAGVLGAVGGCLALVVIVTGVCWFLSDLMERKAAWILGV